MMVTIGLSPTIKSTKTFKRWWESNLVIASENKFLRESRLVSTQAYASVVCLDVQMPSDHVDHTSRLLYIPSPGHHRLHISGHSLPLSDYQQHDNLSPLDADDILTRKILI